MNAVGIPACSKCRTPLPPTAFNSGSFDPCPACGARLRTEIFTALARPVLKGAAGEAVVVSGESACFYHDNKKAAAVCAVCGRFLCALCDCELNGQHFCPGCLDIGRRKQTIGHLETQRMLYGRQALRLAILPLFFTGLIALFLAARYWKAPDSLVSPRGWIMPAALVLAIVQTLGFSFLILYALMT